MNEKVRKEKSLANSHSLITSLKTERVYLINREAIVILKNISASLLVY